MTVWMTASLPSNAMIVNAFISVYEYRRPNIHLGIHADPALINHDFNEVSLPLLPSVQPV